MTLAHRTPDAGSANLDLKDPLGRRRDDRRPRSFDAQGLCEAPANPLRGGGRFPLCTIARRNKPLARGIVRSVATLMAPADSPKIVTLVGSPPIAAMFPCTHLSAAI